MKIKFNPNVAYFTGLWKARKIREGVGISGDSEALQIFISEAINTLGIPPEKIQVKGSKAYFYHSAYRRYFESVVADELGIFKWRNDFACMFIAGIFDGCGGVDEREGTVFFTRATGADQMLMERLGLGVRRIGARLFVTAKYMPTFTKHMLHCMKREDLKSRLSALMRSGNERDPR